MSIAASKAKLAAAHRQLSAALDRASDTWDDPAARAFRRLHVQPLDNSVRAAFAALDHIAEVLERLRKDCEDPPP